jgi:hypothetical protein
MKIIQFGLNSQFNSIDISMKKSTLLNIEKRNIVFNSIQVTLCKIDSFNTFIRMELNFHKINSFFFIISLPLIVDKRFQVKNNSNFLAYNTQWTKNLSLGMSNNLVGRFNIGQKH